MRWFMLATVVSLCSLAWTSSPAPEVQWGPTGLTEETIQLFTPSSGPLFATVTHGLVRSDDGGATWSSAPLPPDRSDGARPTVTVNPVNHNQLFAEGREGLYRSSDDAVTWDLILPTQEAVLGLAVSAADPQVVYLGLASSRSFSGDFRFLRSQNEGDSWEGIEEFHNSLCGWSVPLLMPHPSDPGRVFRVASCYAGRVVNDGIDELRDSGKQWTPFYSPGSTNNFARLLAGGAAPLEHRYYVAGYRDQRAGGGPFMLRSDDEGASWVNVLPASEPTDTISGLALDPALPDRVYISINRRSSLPDQPPIGVVLLSDDAGVTWEPFASGNPGAIHDIALGVDGANLYAATDRGVWRISLTPA